MAKVHHAMNVRIAREERARILALKSGDMDAYQVSTNGVPARVSERVSGAAVRQLVVYQSRPVSCLRYTQLGV